MALAKRYVEYDGPGGPFEGCLVWDDAGGAPRPGVLVFPNVMGPKAFDEEKAEALAALGYVGFVADVYGKGKRPTERDEAFALMTEAATDRKVLQGRILAALATLAAQPEADAGRSAALGFCFGGKCVLDLARSGAQVRGVASFPGLYDAPPFANAANIPAKVLVLHGFDDPLAPPAAMVALGHELTEGGADWQLHAYGHAGHAFTGPGSHGPGLAYQPDADRRSWQALRNFLGELFD